MGWGTVSVEMQKCVIWAGVSYGATRNYERKEKERGREGKEGEGRAEKGRGGKERGGEGRGGEITNSLSSILPFASKHQPLDPPLVSVCCLSEDFYL